jgi:glyceraldehyde 3-phosphate dehydrogenase
MKKINVAINGFGRIGRTFLRKVFLDEKINIVAINDLTAPATLAHLLKYDSIHGKFPATIEAGENYIVVNNIKIEITAEKDPSLLPWNKLNVDVVLESTGKFTKEEDAKKHIIAGAKKVIISAPA